MSRAKNLKRKKEKKARVTVTLTPCIEVNIRGEYQGGMRLRRDNGEVSSFLHFILDNNIYGLRGGGTGGGSYTGYKFPEDLNKLKQWAEENDVEVVERHPMNDAEAEKEGWEAHSMGIKRDQVGGEVPPEEREAWLRGWDRCHKEVEDEDED